jgi:two-component system, sensor histidine kinase and response regulator
MKAPLPENEAARLAALRGLGILDTPPELAYDELCTLAAHICQAPIALISFVDEDRQWFKSRVGWTAEESCRDVAFCAHAILQPDLLVVPDARADERFANNPLVTSPPSIRFYAGAPLVTAAGHALGTLCVLDHKPRELTAEQARALRALSHQVMAHVHLREQLTEQFRINAELARANEALKDEVALRNRTEEALRHSEAALRENERQLNSFLSELPGLAFRCLFNEDWTALYAAGRSPIAGIEAEDLATGRIKYSDILHPEDAEPCARAVAEALARREPFENEHRIFDRQGQVKWILSRGHGIFAEDGSLRFIEGLNIDITEQKTCEEELQKANDRLAVAVRGSHVGVWENDMAEGDYRAGHVHCTNVLEQLGYAFPDSTLDYRTVAAFIHADDREPTEAVLRAYLAGETPEYSVKFRARHRDGTYRWMLSRGVAVRDAAGRPIRFVGTRIDITELKETEEKLRESKARFRAFIDHASDAFYLNTWPEAQFVDVNWQACEALGYTRAELIGMSPFDISPDVTAEMLERLQAQLAAGETVSFDIRNRRKDGSLFPVEVRIRAITLAGRTYGLALVRDITERKRLEHELRQAKEAAEAASRAKSDFLAHVSHEIRTPLNAILGMNELAQGISATDQQRKYLTVVQSSAEALLLVIDDLLDFSKIEAGKLELDRATFSLRTALNETFRSLALGAHRKGLELVGRIRPNVADAFVGDRGRLRQVLTNLVSNAIKFTEQGEVAVEVTSEEQQPEDADAFPVTRHSPLVTLHFSVRDTGIGIPQDKQRKIFEAFEQADGSTTRRYGGTGLGLSIASRLVELMGGRITVESEPGRGSTFRFTVRLHRSVVQPDRTFARAPIELEAVPVLIVDENATSRQTLEEWLRAWRTQPTALGDGSAALEALNLAAAEGRPFGLVVLDSRLRGTEAMDVATHVLQTPELTGSVVILLTVEDQAKELHRYHELGIAACVMKPLVEEELLEAICRARLLPRPTGNRQTPTVPASGRRLRVLLAEDNLFNRAVMEDLLPRRGHAVHVADDGRAALAALEQSRFDVMLLDIHMPELDGFQVAQAQRRREQDTGTHLPIIALTARSAAGERERCLQAGMDDYLAKPVRAAELFATIDRVISGEDAGRPVDANGGVPGDLLDPTALLAACDGNDELLRKMCGHFRTIAPGRLAEVTEAFRDRNAPRLREAAHKLGGMVSSFSATAAEAAALLERLGSDGKIEETTRAHSRLNETMERLYSLLDSVSVDQLRRWREDFQEAATRGQ